MLIFMTIYNDYVMFEIWFILGFIKSTCLNLEVSGDKLSWIIK